MRRSLYQGNKKRIKEHDRDIRLARTHTSAVFEHAHEIGHYPIWDKVKFIDRDPHCSGIHEGSRKLIIDFTLIKSTGIMELKFLKRGCPR